MFTETLIDHKWLFSYLENHLFNIYLTILTKSKLGVF